MTFNIKKTIRNIFKYFLFPILIFLHILTRFFYGEITELVQEANTSWNSYFLVTDQEPEIESILPTQEQYEIIEVYHDSLEN